ncbi:MAG: sigma-70 family RNA polymerase sigma factor [Thermoanaerobaculia bacterium]
MNQRRADDDSGLLRRYLQEISKYPPLSADREKELARVIQDRLAPEERRKDAIDELVRANLRFVVYHAKGFHSPNVPFIDLINEGNIGLIQAARRFDANRNVKFITYAVWWVRQAISHALAEQAGTIRIPHKQATHQFRAVRARDELQRELGREPTHEEIGERTGLDPATVEMLLAVTRNTESLSQGVGSDEQERTLEDVLEQTMVSSADDDMLRRASAEQAREILGELRPKERAVLCRRFGIPEDGSEGEREPMTLQEIGLELELSRERVRQIEAQALQRLRRGVKARRLLSVLR